jgi:hypothetical protein
MFGDMPSYGFFVRHVSGLEMNHVRISFEGSDSRPAFVLRDAQDVALDHMDLERGDGAPLFKLRGVSGFSAAAVAGMADTRLAGPVESEDL